MLRRLFPFINWFQDYKFSAFRADLVAGATVGLVLVPQSMAYAQLSRIASMPDLRHVLIVGNGINELDASGEEMLSRTLKGLREAGYDFSMSGLNDTVLDVMRRTGLYDRIGEDHLYRNAILAVEGIFEDAHAFAEDEDIQHCPLKVTMHRLPEPIRI